jgi:hypothetical protein
MTFDGTGSDAVVAVAMAIERQCRLIEVLEQGGSKSAAEAARRVLTALQNALTLVAPLTS